MYNTVALNDGEWERNKILYARRIFWLVEKWVSSGIGCIWWELRSSFCTELGKRFFLWAMGELGENIRDRNLKDDGSSVNNFERGDDL